MAAVEFEAALGAMARKLNGDPVAQFVLIELADPSPEARAATIAN